MVGVSDGESVTASVGAPVGLLVVGDSDGLVVGGSVLPVGSIVTVSSVAGTVGVAVGTSLGELDGPVVGRELGDSE